MRLNDDFDTDEFKSSRSDDTISGVVIYVNRALNCFYLECVHTVFVDDEALQV